MSSSVSNPSLTEHVADLARDPRHVEHGHVHRDPPGDRCLAPADERDALRPALVKPTMVEPDRAAEPASAPVSG